MVCNHLQSNLRKKGRFHCLICFSIYSQLLKFILVYPQHIVLLHLEKTLPFLFLIHHIILKAFSLQFLLLLILHLSSYSFFSKTNIFSLIPLIALRLSFSIIFCLFHLLKDFLKHQFHHLHLRP